MLILSSLRPAVRCLQGTHVVAPLYRARPDLVVARGGHKGCHYTRLRQSQSAATANGDPRFS
jgi:hypothetical protein